MDDDWERNEKSPGCLCAQRSSLLQKGIDDCILLRHAILRGIKRKRNEESDQMRFTVQRYASVPPNDVNCLSSSSQSSNSTGKDDVEFTGGDGLCHPTLSDSAAIQMGESLQGEVFEDTHHSTIHEDDQDSHAGEVVEGGGNGGVVREQSKPLMTSQKIAQLGLYYHERKTRRLVHKDGSCNVTSENITKRKQKFLVDIFTTLVDMKWRYNLLLFGAAFVLSWVGFATAWFILAVAHGDHVHRDDADWAPCVAHLYDFTTAVLFSVETQHTIGYGHRVIEPTCPAAVVLLMVQSCVGVFIQSLMTGLIFAKLSRPKRRSQTMMFSRNAVVSKQDGQYCLLFRVGDMRKSHFVGTSIRAILVSDKHTKEGETIPLCQFPLDLQTDTCIGDNFVFLVWPTTVVHKITKTSPLWCVASDTLIKEQFEIIVILEGIVESTGMTTQVRTSYLPSEILWGYQLAPLMTYQKENGQYKIDYTQFQQVLPLNSMPPWSARRHQERRGSDTVYDADADNSTSAYFTTVVRSNTLLRHSVLRRMRNSFRRRTTSRETSSTKAVAAAAMKKLDEAEGQGQGSVSSL